MVLNNRTGGPLAEHLKPKITTTMKQQLVGSSKQKDVRHKTKLPTTFQATRTGLQQNENRRNTINKN